MTTSNYSTLLVMTAALVAGVLVLVLAEEPVWAAFPGANGKIVFDSFLPGQADSEIVTLSYNPNGGAVPEDPDPRSRTTPRKIAERPGRLTDRRPPSRGTVISG